MKNKIILFLILVVIFEFNSVCLAKRNKGWKVLVNKLPKNINFIGRLFPVIDILDLLIKEAKEDCKQEENDPKNNCNSTCVSELKALYSEIMLLGEKFQNYKNEDNIATNFKNLFPILKNIFSRCKLTILIRLLPSVNIIYDLILFLGETVLSEDFREAAGDIAIDFRDLIKEQYKKWKIDEYPEFVWDYCANLSQSSWDFYKNGGFGNMASNATDYFKNLNYSTVSSGFDKTLEHLSNFKEKGIGFYKSSGMKDVAANTVEYLGDLKDRGLDFYNKGGFGELGSNATKALAKLKDVNISNYVPSYLNPWNYF